MRETLIPVESRLIYSNSIDFHFALWYNENG